MKKNGFTLVELIVTVVIFSIASVAFFSFFMYNQQTNIKLERKVKMYEAMNNRIEEFKTTYGNSPTDYSNLWNTSNGSLVDSVTETGYGFPMVTYFYIDSSTGTSPSVSPNNVYMKAVVHSGSDSLVQHFILTIRR